MKNIFGTEYLLLILFYDITADCFLGFGLVVQLRSAGLETTLLS